MLVHRIMTGMVLLAYLVGWVYWTNHFFFVFGAALLCGLCLWEWSSLAGLQQNSWRGVYVALGLLAAYFSLFFALHVIVGLGAVVWLLYFAAVVGYQRQRPMRWLLHPSLVAIAGVVVITAFWLALIDLRFPAIPGMTHLFIGFVLVAVADVAAYFVGRQWGKRPLASRVSPKKTWEGFCGGVLATACVALAVQLMTGMVLWQMAIFWVTAMGVCLLTVMGDLTLSMLKRSVGVKDTGFLLPGHGGVLDRVDGALPALVFYACMMRLL